MNYEFIKMHGLGNDFVIFDGREKPVVLRDISAIANRRTGIGCDQLIVLVQPADPANDAFMHIYNDSGHEVNACGNATRCVGWLIAKNGVAKIETNAGLLTVDNITKTSATAHMGQVKFAWQDIPMSAECDPSAVVISDLPLGYCANVGNPHVVFFTDKSILKYGALVENHHMFSQRTNVEFAEVLDRHRIKINIWERDVGETNACGTGACAVAAIAHKKSLVESTCEIISKGGSLTVDLDDQYNAKLTGDVAVSFKGEIKWDVG